MGGDEEDNRKGVFEVEMTSRSCCKLTLGEMEKESGQERAEKEYWRR